MNPNSVTLCAVGDVMLGDSPVMVGMGVRSKNDAIKDASIFNSVRPILKNADFCFGNLECVLADSKNAGNSLLLNQMRGRPEDGKRLKETGFNVMSVANNHIMQHGKRPYHDTLCLLERNNIKPVGIAEDKDLCVPFFRAIKGLIFCFLAYSLRPEKYCTEAEVLYAKTQVSSIVTQLRSLKRECDVIVLSLHWGDEFIEVPAQEQIESAHLLIDAGASIILGHHSHTLQGIERYKHGVIAYSLGNFVFDFFQRRLRKSIILNLEITKNEIDYRIYPVYITRNFCPILPNEALGKSIVHKIQKLSRMVYEIQKRGDAFYKLRVKINSLLIKIENRIFFILNFSNYPGTIAYQSLANFFSIRLRRKSNK